MNVKPRLNGLLKDRNITQVELSKLSGVPQGSVSRFDKNERHTDWHVFAIARAMDVKIEDLFEIEE